MSDENFCILREEQIWNRIFVPHKNAIRIIVDAVNEREVVRVDVQPGDVGNELEITIPKEVVSFTMRVRGNSRAKISPVQGDIANEIYFSLGPHWVWKEQHLASDEDFKIYIEMEKQRDIEIFLWKGNFQA